MGRPVFYGFEKVVMASLNLRSRGQFAVLFLISALAAASMWFYVDRILIPYQKADALAHDRPRGNLSDLYPRWLGARELLLHGRNPYSREVTVEIQQGYYGRQLDPSNPDDPKDQEGFVYPAYVVFLLAPTIKIPFEIVQACFRWLLAGLCAVSVLLWLRSLQWKLSVPAKLLCMLLTLGSIPVVQGIKLQQLSLLVAGILAACAGCMAAGFLFSAGVLLALATIKPQLAWPLVLWLLLWSASEWRSRWKLMAGFALAMVLLLGGAELVLPGWLRMFIRAIHEYHEYTQNQSILQWLFGAQAGSWMEWLVVGVCAFCLWPFRREPASSAGFGWVFSLVLALTVLIVPMYAPYNQVLLLPAILSLARTLSFTRNMTPGVETSPAVRFAGAIGGLFLVWPWVATIVLTAASFWLTNERSQKVWTLPFYSTFAFPIFVFGVLLLETRNRNRTGTAKSA